MAEIEDQRHIPKSSYWLVFLLILPLSLGNFNNGQVNPMIIGLLMMAILAAHEKRWTLSAVALGFSTYLKIYPLSVGLLLVLLYPRQLGWRLALTLILMGAASFVLQRPAYVLEQYQRWFNTRAADDRRMNMDIAPRDFAMILRLLHINLSAHAVLFLEILAGAGAAAICLLGVYEKWSEQRLLTCVFTTGYLLDAAFRSDDRRCDLRDDRPGAGVCTGAGFSSKDPSVDASFGLRIFCHSAFRA